MDTKSQSSAEEKAAVESRSRERRVCFFSFDIIVVLLVKLQFGFCDKVDDL